MAKTNFTKVEEVLDQTLKKISVHQLFELADEPKKNEAGQDKAKSKLIDALKRDIQNLDPKRHKSLYKGLGLKKQDIKQLISSPDSLSPQDWEKIKQIKAEIDKYRKETAALLPHDSNETLVEQERRKHVNKRFNVNDKWLPLH